MGAAGCAGPRRRDSPLLAGCRRARRAPARGLRCPRRGLRRAPAVSLSSAPLARAVDALGGPRERLQALGRDGLAAGLARAVRALVERPERRLDAVQLHPRPIAQRQVALLLEDVRRRRGLRAVGHLAGALDRLAELDEQPLALGDEGSAR